MQPTKMEIFSLLQYSLIGTTLISPLFCRREKVELLNRYYKPGNKCYSMFFDLSRYIVWCCKLSSTNDIVSATLLYKKNPSFYMKLDYVSKKLNAQLLFKRIIFIVVLDMKARHLLCVNLRMAAILWWICRTDPRFAMWS